MSWVKLDDGFWSHPKVVGLTDRAHRLYVNALSYSAGHLTDGMLTLAQLKMLDRVGHGHGTLGDATDTLGRRNEGANRYANFTLTVQELVSARLFEVVASGWRIHDYHQYNPTREQVLNERQKARERMNVRRNNGRTSGEVPEKFAKRSRAPSRPVPKDKEVPRSREHSAPNGGASPAEAAGAASDLTPIAPVLQEVLEGSRMRLKVTPPPA